MAKYVLLAFAHGGGLVEHQVVKTQTEDELNQQLAQFEDKTVGFNNGEFVAVLKAREIHRISSRL